MAGSVNIVSYASGSERIMATIRLGADGEVVIRGKLPPALQELLMDARERAKTPEAFLERLPSELHGSIIRAIPVKAPVKQLSSSFRPFNLADWDESQHPRDDHGKFTDGGGSGADFAGLLKTIGQPDGGFTVQPVSGAQPKTGYALSLFKGRERVRDVGTLKLTDLAQFAKDNKDLLSQSDNYFGAWHNPEDHKIYMDVSKVVTDASEAERLGRDNDQLAYFDLGKGQSVPIAKR